MISYDRALIPGAFLCLLALFSRGPKGAAVAGLIVGFPGTIFFAFVGLGMIMGFLGLGAAATSAVNDAQKVAAETRTKVEQEALDAVQTTESASSDSSADNPSEPAEINLSAAIEN